MDVLPVFHYRKKIFPLILKEEKEECKKAQLRVKKMTYQFLLPGFLTIKQPVLRLPFFLKTKTRVPLIMINNVLFQDPDMPILLQTKNLEDMKTIAAEAILAEGLPFALLRLELWQRKFWEIFPLKLAQLR